MADEIGRSCKECFARMTGVSLTRMLSLLDSSRTPSQVTKKCYVASLRNTFNRRSSAEMYVLFAARPLSLEAPPLKQRTCTRKQGYYNIFVLESTQMLSLCDTPTESLSPHKSCKIAGIWKLRSLWHRCTDRQQYTSEEEKLKFVNSLHQSRPFYKVLRDYFCGLGSL